MLARCAVALSGKRCSSSKCGHEFSFDAVYNDNLPLKIFIKENFYLALIYSSYMN